MLRSILLLTMLTIAGRTAAQAPWQGARAAFFGVSFIDTSHEGELGGPRADEAARLQLVEDYLADEFRRRGLELVDLAPVAEELDRIANPADCNGCETRMANRLGAQVAIVAEVQKVSNLIQSMNVVVRDASTGAPVAGLAVDVRGNTDDSWLRGMRYILDRGIFVE